MEYARLILTHRYDLVRRRDFGRVQVSTDTTDPEGWKDIGIFTGTRGWRTDTLVIPPEWLGSRVFFRLFLASLGEGGEGWFVDDLILQADQPPRGPLAIPLRVEVEDTLEGGNRNGIPEPGEKADIRFRWVLQGEQSLTRVILRPQVSAGLRVDDAYPFISRVEPGDTVENVFRIRVDPEVPYAAPLEFRLVVEALEGRDTLVHRFRAGKIYWTPDELGGPYIALDNTDTRFHPRAPVFHWVDITEYGLPWRAGDSDFLTLIVPWQFRFYGLSTNTFWISSDGWVSLDDGMFFPGPEGIHLGNVLAPYRYVAALLDDLDPGNGSTYIYYAVEPDARRLIVSYEDVPHRDDPSRTERFQIIFQAGEGGSPGEILIQFARKPAQTDFLVGIEYQLPGYPPQGTVRYYENGVLGEGAAPIDSGRAILYTPASPIVEKEEPTRPFLQLRPDLRVVRPWVQVALPDRRWVNLKVLDPLGRQRAVLFEGVLPEGRHAFPLPGGLPPGVYVIRMKAPPDVLSRKVVFGGP